MHVLKSGTVRTLLFINIFQVMLQSVVAALFENIIIICKHLREILSEYLLLRVIKSSIHSVSLKKKGIFYAYLN